MKLKWFWLLWLFMGAANAAIPGDKYWAATNPTTGWLNEIKTEIFKYPDGVNADGSTRYRLVMGFKWEVNYAGAGYTEKYCKVVDLKDTSLAEQFANKGPLTGALILFFWNQLKNSADPWCSQ